MGSVVIESRYQGVQDVAHGGYVGGLLSLGRPAEVRFLRPVRMGRPLSFEDQDDGTTAALDGETLLAIARPARIGLDVPARVSLEDAVLASADYPGHRRHLFPACFVCGPDRPEGDGLRIFPGRVANHDLVAAPWTPARSLGRPDGTVSPEFIWAAVDCPSIWALIQGTREDSEDRVVTSKLAVEILAPVRSGEPCVVMGWPLGQDGHPHTAGAAVLSADGRTLAIAKQTLATTTWGVPLSRAAWGLSADG